MRDLAGSTTVSRKQLVGWLLVAQLPLKWILRTVERLGDIDFVLTHVHDPGWVGTLLRMFSDVVRGPEIIIFLLGVGWLAYLHRHPTLSETASVQEGISLPVPISPQDIADREKIAFFWEAHAKPANVIARQVTRRLWDRLRNVEDEKGRTIVGLGDKYGFKPCALAAAALTYELVGPDRGNIKLLQQRVREFFNAYQGLVNWTNELTGIFSYPLSGDLDYHSWQEKHKLFYMKMTELLATEGDSSELKRGLKRDWPDILG